MAYHDDLLTQALQLIRVTPPSQLALRRAVSAAYYAVFHYLIAEATSNWNNVPLRTALGRGYDHSTMKAASNRILNLKDFPYTGEEPTAVANLRFVAQTFSQLQEDRHFADYNLTKDLDPVEAFNAGKIGGENLHHLAHDTRRTNRASVSCIVACETGLDRQRGKSVSPGPFRGLAASP